jgi:voltage-dependent potassium channel beta subunit
MTIARDAGVNCFDHAEAYGNPNGEAERLFGIALSELREEYPEKWRRSELIITTKIFWGGNGVNESGLSRKHILEGLDASLERLQVDYVDMVFCHRPDPLTPTSTVVRAMNDAVRNGWATSWGTSEWSAAQIMEAIWFAKSEGLEPPIFEQEYFPLFKPPYNYGTTIWSPLRSGFLTGKYNEGIPEGSRPTQEGYEWLIDDLEKRKKDGQIEIVKSLSEYASDQFGCSTAQLALAWCLKNPNVSTILLGATKPEQMEENLGCIEVAKKMNDVHMDEINLILGNKPEDWIGYGGSGARDIRTM